jgi:hypothetical protein
MEYVKMYPAGHARVPSDTACGTHALPKSMDPGRPRGTWQASKLYVKERSKVFGPVNTLVHLWEF